MKKSRFIYTRTSIFIATILVGVILSGCGPSPEEQTSTAVALTATATTSTPTVTPTLTPTPTSTLEPTPDYIPAPRWMLLGQPGPNVEILGERWEYYGDVWREFSACIQYQQNDYTRHFEECFVVINEDDPTFTFDQVLSPFLENDYVKLIPKSTFGEVGQISLVGQIKDDGTARFLELLGTQKYIYLVEMGVTVLEDAPLQAIYEDLAADVMDYLLKDILQKSRVVLPTPTPLSNFQQNLFDFLGGLLVTEQEAGEGWEAIGDSISDTHVQLCRSFELRVNEDVLWVAFRNCIYDPPVGFEIGDLADSYSADDVLLESSHSYTGDFVLYGYYVGHTYYDAWLFQDSLLYQVTLDSRTPMGNSIENLFTQSVDDFLHNILMINLEKSG